MPRTLAPLCSIALVALALAAAPAPAGPLPEVKFEKYRLANGLEVILHEDHSTPIVAVNVWYHVGSKNERPGRTGFAHLFEHMMFQGSRHWDDEYFKPIQEAGGSINGSTNTDRTNYWENVPANFLERALWLEADRMGFLLDAMTQAKLDNQRDVVKNERRQSYENQPYGVAREVLVEAAYPARHPYSWLTIGSMDDLSAASMDDVKDFFRRYYTPSNATLAIAGDFAPAEARRLVEKHFGALPPGPPVWKFTAFTPALEGERRVTVQDRVQLPRVYLLWHTVPAFSRDDAALEVLAQLLGQGKSSRLYEALVHERQIAQDVTAAHDAREIAGALQITATARPGHTAEELVAAIDAELERLRAEGPSEAEVRRVQNKLEAELVRGMQRVGGFGGVADQLNYYNHYLGDPGYFQRDLDRHLSLGRADVQRVAREYLKAARVVLRVEPMPKLSPADSELARGVDRGQKPEGGPAPALSLPEPQRAELGNGLKLLVVEHHELPVLELRLVVGAGSAADPPGAAGLANLTAQMLDKGTATRKALDIARELDSMGAVLALATDVDSSSAALSTLKSHAEAALAVLADAVLHPSFAEDELERTRKQLLTRLLQEKDQPNAIAAKATAQVLYGDAHPYGHPEIGTEASLPALARADVERFYRGAWVPNGATLVVVGDTTLAEAKRLAEGALGGWARGETAAIGIAPVKPPDGNGGERRVYVVDRPGAAQSIVAVSQVGLSRADPDYFPALVLNAAFGGMFTSRLNLNLREDKGYTYGARSSFSFRRGEGPFTASAGVHTKVTKESVAEFMKELDELRSTRPLSAEELRFAKGYLERGLPQDLETPGQIADRLRDLVVYGLPDDFYNTYSARVEAVSAEDVKRAAARLHPESAAVVVVGDMGLVRARLEELKLGPTVTLDPAGRPLQAAK